MQRLKFVVIKNALANTVRGGASSIVVLVLPHFLTRNLSVDRYSSWVLMLQIAAYANYLDFGLQTAVARYLAQAIERRDEAQQSQVVTSALFLLSAAGALTVIVASAVLWQLPRVFPGAPHALLGELRVGVGVLALSAAISLPLSVFTGILIGLHRNEYPAIAIGVARLMGAGGVLALLPFTHSLVWFAVSVGGCNFLGGLAQVIMAKRLMPNMRVQANHLIRRTLRELLNYCAGMTAFSVGMLLVGGLDLTIVGYFAFDAAGYYGVAITIIAFVTGLSGAIYNALLAPMAVFQERKENDRIRQMVLVSTRLGTYVSLMLIVAVSVMGKYMLGAWVGAEYARQALPILIILLCAQAIRLLGGGYAIALVATAQQKHGIIGALAEGVANLVTSIIGAFLWGPIGVAWGTVFGSICGIIWLVLYTMRRAREIEIDRYEFTVETAFRPLACFTPVLAYLVLNLKFHAGAFYLPISLLVTALLLLRFGRIPLSRRLLWPEPGVQSV